MPCVLKSVQIIKVEYCILLIYQGIIDSLFLVDSLILVQDYLFFFFSLVMPVGQKINFSFINQLTARNRMILTNKNLFHRSRNLKRPANIKFQYAIAISRSREKQNNKTEKTLDNYAKN